MKTRYMKVKSTYFMVGGFRVMRTGNNPQLMGCRLTSQEADDLIAQLKAGVASPGVVEGSFGKGAE